MTSLRTMRALLTVQGNFSGIGGGGNGRIRISSAGHAVG